MKFSLLILVFLCVYCQISIAQPADLTLGVIMPNASADFDLTQIQKLEGKIVEIINNSNIAMVGYDNDLVVYPVISVEESAVADGGMQKIVVSTVNLSLFVKQISTKLIFNSISKKLKGSGGNKYQSIVNAISQIHINDMVFEDFIKTAKNKIISYYAANCSSIIKKSEQLSSAKEYEAALSILESIPSSVPCYTEAQNKSIEIYKKYQTILCAKNITIAKSKIAEKDYSSALETLQLIDPGAICYPEVAKLIDLISAKIDRPEKQKIALENRRIDAIKEIAKSYYANALKEADYNMIILQ